MHSHTTIPGSGDITSEIYKNEKVVDIKKEQLSKQSSIYFSFSTAGKHTRILGYMNYYKGTFSRSYGFGISVGYKTLLVKNQIFLILESSDKIKKHIKYQNSLYLVIISFSCMYNHPYYDGDD